MTHRSPPLERSGVLAREGSEDALGEAEARARHEEAAAAMSVPYAVQLVGQAAALDDHTRRCHLDVAHCSICAPLEYESWGEVEVHALDLAAARMVLRDDGADHSSAISAARETSMLRLLDGP